MALSALIDHVKKWYIVLYAATEIFALRDGARTDLIVYYPKGQPQISGTWKYKYFTANDKVKDFLGTVRESEVVTTGNRYLVFYK